MKRLTTIILAALCCQGAAFAQGASFLEGTPDARSLAVAGATAAQEASAYSVWSNAASTVFSDDKFSAGASYGLLQPSFSDVQQLSLAGYGRISERWSVNAGFRYGMYPSVETADGSGIYTGSFSPSAMQASVGAAFRILPSLAVSATAAYVRSDIGGPKAAGAVGFDLGLLFRSKGFSAALTAANLGTRLDYGGAQSYSLPSRIDLGAGYGIGRASGSRHTLDISAQGSLPLAGKGMKVSGGLRYGFDGIFNVAAGYNCGLGGLPSYATLGAGVRLFGVALDFAYAAAAAGSPMNGTMVFNLSYAF